MDTKKPPINLLNAIKNCSGALIFSHTKPDGDAISSSIAMALSLNSLGKSTSIFSESTDLLNNYLNDIKEITKTDLTKKININGLDCNGNIIDFGKKPIAIILDCPNLERVGKIWNEINKFNSFTDYKKDIYIIDHHIGEDKSIGETIYIDESAKSASSLVFRVIKDLKIKFDSILSTILLFGISTDTGFFKFIREYEKDTFFDAAFLVEKGASPQDIEHSINGRRTLKETKYLAALIDGIQLYAYTDKKNYRKINSEDEIKNNEKIVAILKDNKKYFTEVGEDKRPSGDLYNIVLKINNLDCLAFLKYSADSNITTVSLRGSKSSNTNLSDLARCFGGGGHLKASSFKIEKNFDDAENAFLGQLVYGETKIK